MHAEARARQFPLWRAPLLPVAVAWTAGVLVDRWLEPSLFGIAIFGLVFLLAWGIATLDRPRGLGVFFLMLVVACAGAAVHHWRYRLVADDDIRQVASDRPRLVHLRGRVEFEPQITKQSEHPLRTLPPQDSLRLIVRVTGFASASGWQTASGRVRVTVRESSPTVRAGDEVEVRGLLERPPTPGNPGEFDYAEFLNDRSIGAVVRVGRDQLAVTDSGEFSLSGVVGAARRFGQATLEKSMPADLVGLSSALLLGDSDRMSPDDWEKYLRTGGIYVLAISGQHLVILAWFVWLALRVLRIRRRAGALVVAGFLVFYALLAGGRPPVLRAAWAVSAFAAGVWLRRPDFPANLLALSWLGVAVANPADIFNAGFQLSFLSVAVLFFAFRQREEIDPLQKLEDESRPLLLHIFVLIGRWTWLAYKITFALALAVTPLVMFHYHLVTPANLLIGPWMTILSTVALLAGFALLLLHPLIGPLAQPFAWTTTVCLRGCEWLVDVCIDQPWAYSFVADVPSWLLVVFYLGLFAFLIVPAARPRWRWFLGAGVGWAAVVLALQLGWLRTPEFRATFLAVGHGGCFVLETPSGGTILFDAGTLAGPDVTRRQIAPFLWSRGLRRIDELLISHADLDHFNGVVELAQRFRIGKATVTPSFAEREGPAVRFTLESLERRGIPVGVIERGQSGAWGEVAWQVLHPPADGPSGKENARSLVMMLRHRGFTLLLTGDLEEPGLDQVLSRPAPKMDILASPHHGSLASNTPRLAHWAQPALVVSSQARIDPPRFDPFTPLGVPFLSTGDEGAVTLRIVDDRLQVESFRTGKQWEIPRRPAP